MAAERINDMREKETRNKKDGARGFTLLLAALVASVVLALGAAIYGLVVKELELSGLGRDSQFAFFAADTAAECALYWDVRHQYFGQTAPADVNPPQPECDSQSLSPAVSQGIRTAYPYTMTFIYAPEGYCAEVYVEKCDGPIATDGTCTHAGNNQVTTRIHADGYSTSCAVKSANSGRVLQRSVELRY